MNNQPVAWMHKTYFPNGLYEEDLVWSKVDESSIPLYTHPAKTLTDEEIINTGLEIGIVSEEELTEEYAQDYVEDVVKFARAILRKAQEK